MEKRINVAAAALAIQVGLFKVYSDLEEEFEKYPEDPNGVLVTLEQVRVGLELLEKTGLDYIENIIGTLPNVEIPVEEELEPGTGTAKIVKLKAYSNRSFNWIPLHITNAMKGRRVRFRFDRGCGQFEVPNGSITHGEDGNTQNHNQRFYFCGTDYPAGSPENNNGMASIFTASGCVADKVEITIYEASKVSEHARYHGRHNGDRPTWYFSKDMRDYPKQFTIVVEGCSETLVTYNNGTRFVKEVIVKQSDVSSRGMAIVAPASCKSTACYIRYGTENTQVDEEEESIKKTEPARYHGRNSVNNRPVWYFPKTMKEYPRNFTIVVEGCGRLVVRGNTGTRIDFDESGRVVGYNQSRDRYFVRQSLVTSDPRGMVIVAPRGCKATSCYLVYDV